jgi:hypothetical protein
MFHSTQLVRLSVSKDEQFIQVSSWATEQFMTRPSAFRQPDAFQGHEKRFFNQLRKLFMSYQLMAPGEVEETSSSQEESQVAQANQLFSTIACQLAENHPILLTTSWNQILASIRNIQFNLLIVEVFRRLKQEGTNLLLTPTVIIDALYECQES